MNDKQQVKAVDITVVRAEMVEALRRAEAALLRRLAAKRRKGNGAA